MLQTPASLPQLLRASRRFHPKERCSPRRSGASCQPGSAWNTLRMAWLRWKGLRPLLARAFVSSRSAGELRRFYERDARLRSLIVALREIDHRNTEENRGALAAAEAIERALHVARRQTPRNADPRGGRSLIERLQTDPLATL